MTKKPVIGEIDPEDIVDVIEEESARRLYWQEGEREPNWLPPTRPAEFKTYRLAMIDFAEWHVRNKMPEPDLTPNSPEVSDRQAEWVRLEPARQAARRGDFAPLRSLLPDEAEFLNPAKWPKHAHKTRPPRPSFNARLAADMVAEVNALWMRTYKKARRAYAPKTVEIVADIFGVAEREIVSAQNEDVRRRYKKKKDAAKTGTIS